ncbi:hypothetical protein E1301_Tti011428 [Triplophysa tibetana]|uniref:Chemokine interleukin-8-like domain-containing protein n=1 Tax=Triplophysa tibetana TaxID=1572043 RepID=A0A5A9PA63_9TELE|nr:hypothetical protein E1301_Tti011428 [Triplophysa tibetana]
MQFNKKVMKTIAAIAVIMMIQSTLPDGQNKHHECCTSVSTETITSTITGFRLQQRNLPCVKAVIFYTEEGETLCTYSKLRWVKLKVQELRKLQHQKQNMNMNNTVSTPLSTTSS